MVSRFFVGVDISKKSFSCTLIDVNSKVLWSAKSIINNESGFKKFLDNVIKIISKKSDSLDFSVSVALESTGVYGEQFMYFLSDNNLDNKIVLYELNPSVIVAFRKSLMEQNKNDNTDAKVIASYISVAVAKNNVLPWVAPSKEERLLKDLSRRRDELVALIEIERNRLEKIYNAHDPSEKVHDNVESHVDYLNKSLEEIEKEIESHINKSNRLKEDVDLLRSIPGIGAVNSVTLKSEFGDLSKFSSVKALVSLVGIAPCEHSSGTSIHKRPHISRQGNSRVRNHLFMAALVASQSNPIIKNYYNKLLERGKSKKVALVACMRKLIHIVWGVLKTRTAFDPCYGLL